MFSPEQRNLVYERIVIVSINHPGQAGIFLKKESHGRIESSPHVSKTDLSKKIE
ncbi:protein of unknown function [Xenorhabdus nematophila AN6/1]|nr:protein of unknown function [Xenorhabdus nematophila AN6/1]